MLLKTIIPSHSIGVWLENAIESFLDSIGLSRFQTLEEIIYFVVILFASFAIGWVVRKLVLWGINKALEVHATTIAKEMIELHTVSKCSHVITPLVFLGLVPLAFESSAEIHTLIMKAALLYTVVMVGMAVTAVMRLIFVHFNRKENTKGLPLDGIFYLGNGIAWGLVVIVCISILVEKSPMALLGGLTAFAAVLMLVFKDTILGFVAGIQMSQNDMVRVGDWIVVPSTVANGVVIDVSLSTVKVQNFDNTIVTVPPYTLVSTGVQNWRGMTESGMRRIAESIYINPDSISIPSADMLDKLGSQYPAMKNFIEGLQKAGKTVVCDKGQEPLNGSLESNLGLFRAYMTAYLLDNDMINHASDLMVCVKSPTHEGVPLQIYCFAATTQWEQYEAILSTVIEHALVQAPSFGLEILSADHLSVTTEQEKANA